MIFRTHLRCSLKGNEFRKLKPNEQRLRAVKNNIYFFRIRIEEIGFFESNSRPDFKDFLSDQR